MNNDKTILQIEAIKEWSTYKSIQVNFGNRWESVVNLKDWPHSWLPDQLNGPFKFRLTPVPTLVPWTYESVPMELGWVCGKGELQNNSSLSRCSVERITPEGLFLRSGRDYSFERALIYLNWYDPSSKSWMPCGTSQEAK